MCIVTGAVGSIAAASDVVEVLPLTNRVLMVHFDDGYVIHSKKGQLRTDEQVVIDALNTSAADLPTNYKIVSADDLAYKTAKRPLQLGRKSKGTDYAWFTDRWVGDHFENDRPDHTKEHWIYLSLPTPMLNGKTYTLDTGALAKNGRKFSLKFNDRTTRSEAVHVNIIGYAPAAPSKFAYLYAWLGNRGGADLAQVSGKRFYLIDQATNVRAFTGTVSPRRKFNDAETGQAGDTPNANFQGADVYECDFSPFKKTGRYVLAVEGVGVSFPFKIDPDVYREPFVTVTRGLYHNRSGIALKRPYTEFTRPAPHNPTLTPGFAGKLKYTTSRFIDWKNADMDAADKPAIEAGIKGVINVSGFYQDAGDWDSYASHLRVAQQLLLMQAMAPKNFADGELNIPESGNGVPDIIDEAAWLPRFAQKLRKTLIAKTWGTGGIGLRVCGDHFGGDGEGVPSYEDTNRTWIVSGEDPVSTFGYAGVAAQLAIALQKLGIADPKSIDWRKEAIDSYQWASQNTRTGDEPKVKENRIYAAAALFKLTGQRSYENQLRTDTNDLGANSLVWGDALFGPALYALAGGVAAPHAETLARIRAALLNTANQSLATADKRAMRYGGNFYFPMLVGQQSTPAASELAVGYTLTKGGDPATARAYLAAIYTTCDYFLGTNPLNMAYATGLGARHPNQAFHMDAWYNGKNEFHPGIVPYGPWRKQREKGQGPWDHDWVNDKIFPAIDQWPGGERWFDFRCSPLSGEFTIHQNTAPAAAIYGFLCAPKS